MTIGAWTTGPVFSTPSHWQLQANWPGPIRGGLPRPRRILLWSEELSQLADILPSGRTPSITGATVADAICQDLADVSGAQSNENRMMIAETTNISTGKDDGTLRMAGTTMPALAISPSGHISSELVG